MLTLSETKNFLRVDDEEDDALITSLIITSKVLIEDIIRDKIFKVFSKLKKVIPKTNKKQVT